MPALPRPGERRPLPGEAGVVLLGWTSLDHISATLLDLAERGFVRIERVPRDWLLTQVPAPAGSPDGLTAYEAALLDGLSAVGDQIRLSGLDIDFGTELNRVRRKLTRDVVRHGWLHRWHKGRRTPSGERLSRQLHAMRRDLDRRLSDGDERVLADYLPYAVIFGLADRRQPRPGRQARPPSGHEAALAPFARAFRTHCSAFTDWNRPLRELYDTWSHDQWAPSVGIWTPSVGTGASAALPAHCPPHC